LILAIIIFILRVLIISALFAFLGWLVFTLWRELSFQSQSISARKIPFISLSQDGNEAESRQIFTQPELRIGRDPACEIHLSDDTVSSHHARLWFRNKQWWVEDMLSTNGTYLNEEKIETPTILISGDELRIGKIILIVEIQSAA